MPSGLPASAARRYNPAGLGLVLGDASAAGLVEQTDIVQGRGIAGLGALPEPAERLVVVLGDPLVRELKRDTQRHHGRNFAKFGGLTVPAQDLLWSLATPLPAP